MDVGQQVVVLWEAYKDGVISFTEVHDRMLLLLDMNLLGEDEDEDAL